MMLVVCAVLLLAAVPSQGMQLRAQKPSSRASETQKWIERNIGKSNTAYVANNSEEARLITASGEMVTGPRAIDIAIEENLYVCPRGKRVMLGSPNDCEQEVVQNNQCGNIFAVKEKENGKPGDACMCCKEVPADQDCVTCLPGKGKKGWQVGAIVGAGEAWTVKRLTANKPATCNMESQHAWAAMQSYGGSLAQYMPYIDNYRFMIKSAAWTYTKTLVWTNQTATDTGTFDTDAIVLWQKGGDCMIAFRGSDTQVDFYNDWDHTPRDYMGLKSVSNGMVTEMDPLLPLFKAELPSLEKQCTGTTSIVGHSLGGALMQMLGALLNLKSNPLSTTLRTGALYGWGPMPPAQFALVNEASDDGCFAGGLHLDAVKASGGNPVKLDLGGTEGANPTPAGGPWMVWNKAKMYFLYGPGDFDVLECGEPFPTWTKVPSLSPWHDFDTYTDNMACTTDW